MLGSWDPQTRVRVEGKRRKVRRNIRKVLATFKKSEIKVIQRKVKVSLNLHLYYFTLIKNCNLKGKN